MGQEQFELPPPAVFDVNASINARPVELLRPPLVGAERSSLRHAFITIRTRAFALVVIVGLSVGALAGTILVNHTDTTVQAQSTMAASEIAASADVAVTGVASPYPTRRVVRRHRRTMSFPRLDQAYRVAVIH